MKDRERTNFPRNKLQEIFRHNGYRMVTCNFWKIARRYSCMAEEQALKKHASGRKNSFTQPQIAEILALQDQGRKSPLLPGNTRFPVRRFTVRSNVPTISATTLMWKCVWISWIIMNFVRLLTLISDMRKLQYRITQIKLPLRAFGVVTDPSWADFEYFLEDRCFPKNPRPRERNIKGQIGVPFWMIRFWL